LERIHHVQVTKGRLVRRVKALVVGNPLDARVQVGPIINERQAVNAERIVSQTVAKGAKLLTGGSRNGLFFEPTVITGVTAGMAAFDEEVIALANATEYGLSAAVASSDLARAQRVADGLHSGAIHINDQTVVHGIYGPIGGVGISGNGFGRRVQQCRPVQRVAMDHSALADPRLSVLIHVSGTVAPSSFLPLTHSFLKHTVRTMSTARRIDVHQHVVRPFWAEEPPSHCLSRYRRHLHCTTGRLQEFHCHRAHIG
jgi:hypothetical protein